MKAPKATPSPNDRGYTSGLDERLFFLFSAFKKEAGDVPGLPIESQLDGWVFIENGGGGIHPFPPAFCQVLFF